MNEYVKKLSNLCRWLIAHQIEYVNPVDWKYSIPSQVMLITKKNHIAVIICKPEEEKLVYEDVCKAHCRAFFIRENETEDFVLEKMRNCLHGYTVKTVKQMEAEEAKETPKPKRKRIHFVRCQK